MVNYENSVIYKITCRDTGEKYIGATSVSIEKRMNKHKAHAKMYDNGTITKKCTSYEIMKRGNYNVEILEKYPCESKLFLGQRERYWIEKDKEQGNNLNKVIPTRPKKEYDNAYYEERKEEIKEKRADYFTEYNQKDETKDRKHEWYLANKEKSIEACKVRRAERVECEVCGKWYTKCRHSEHIKQDNHKWSVEHGMKYLSFKERRKLNMI